MRVVRVLIYTGEKEIIERTLMHGSVPFNGSKIIPGGILIQSAAVVSNYEAILEAITSDNLRKLIEEAEKMHTDKAELDG